MFQQTVTNDFRKYKCVIHSANAKCKITITIRYIIKHDVWVNPACVNALELEEELKIVGNNMKSLEISEQEVEMDEML